MAGNERDTWARILTENPEPFFGLGMLHGLNWLPGNVASAE